MKTERRHLTTPSNARSGYLGSQIGTPKMAIMVEGRVQGLAWTTPW